MNRLLTSTAVMVLVMVGALAGNLPAQDGEVMSGSCYFQASEDTYLKIYHVDKEGVERGAVWKGFLAVGETKAFDAPYGVVGFATRRTPNDPWNEDEVGCINGVAIDIP